MIDGMEILYVNVNHFTGPMYTSESHKRQVPVPTLDGIVKLNQVCYLHGNFIHYILLLYVQIATITYKVSCSQECDSMNVDSRLSHYFFKVPVGFIHTCRHVKIDSTLLAFSPLPSPPKQI